MKPAGPIWAVRAYIGRLVRIILLRAREFPVQYREVLP